MITGIAEELVDRLLDLGERGAQLLDDAAHRLPIGDAPVQLLHPRLERLGRLLLAHPRQPLAEPLDPFGVLGLVEVAVVERGLEIEQAGRDLHRQRRGRCRLRLLRLHDRGLQLGGERLAEREQTPQRVADERELLGQAAHAVHLATGRRRPGFLGGGDALLGVGDDGRIEAAEDALRVVGRRLIGKAVRNAHRGQARHVNAASSRRGLGAEEENVASESLGDVGVALLQQAELRQQARGDALGEDVEAEQAVVLRLEHRRGEVPESAHLRMRGAGAEAGADLAHLSGGGERLLAAHERQEMAFELGADGRVGVARADVGIARDLAPAPVERPEIGRMDALGLDRLLDRAVGREQRERRDLLAGKQAREVVEQAERRVLDVGDELGRERLGLGDAALDRGLARAQDDRRGRQADQLERADSLVDLRARGSQDAGVDGIDVRAGDGLGVLQETAQRLVRGLERAAQLLVDPGDRAEVVGRPRGRQFIQTHEVAVHRSSRRMSGEVGARSRAAAIGLRRS